jgi:Helix-turn-helix of DDE superfamily endonuclease
LYCDLSPSAARALISRAKARVPLRVDSQSARVEASGFFLKAILSMLIACSRVGMKDMKFETLGDEKFRRLTGVKRPSFNKMVSILNAAIMERKSHRGRKKKLSVENALLMTLEYIREYRTYFHVSQSYGLSESSTYKTVKWVENTLIKHPCFALPGRKALLKSDIEYELVLIDATETPIERPKKSKGTFIRERRKGTL